MGERTFEAALAKREKANAHRRAIWEARFTAGLCIVCARPREPERMTQKRCNRCARENCEAVHACRARKAGAA